MKATEGHQSGRNTVLPPGKLPIKILDRLLKRYASSGNGVVVGPSIGIDAAIIRLGDRYLIAKTDPITFVAADIGHYAIHINANDIAVMGGRPRWFLATMLLPEKGTTARSVERIFSQLSSACTSIGITLCGGHTEITIGLERPIVVGQMLGEVRRETLITAAGARVGDTIILTKGIAIEGTSIIAREMGGELTKRFTNTFVKRCTAFSKKPGISVVKDAEIALKKGNVHAMHDPTEGGLATGLYELATASNTGALIEGDAIPVLPECRRLCDYFGIDPVGLIASGALLMTVDQGSSDSVLKGLHRGGITAGVIGKVVAKGQGINISEDGRKRPLRPFERDEITKVLS
ncbi:MAG: AIR synthase family protein [Thermodesulfobacteriota bacterium]